MGTRIALLIVLMLLSNLGSSGSTPKLPVLQETISNLNQRARLIHKIYQHIESSEEFAISDLSLIPLGYKGFPSPLKEKIQELNAQYSFFSESLGMYHKTQDPVALKEIAICVEDLDVLHQKISFEVEKIWKDHDFPYQAESELLRLNKELVGKGIGIMQSVRGGLKLDFQRKVDSTQIYFQKWKQEAWELYAEFPPESKDKVKWKLELIESQWGELLNNCNNYESMQLPKGFEYVEKKNYFYNHSLTPLMVSDGKGLVNLHNSLSSDLGSPLPPVLSMMPWIHSPEVSKEELPKHFIVLIDNSASMSKASRMASIKHFLPQWISSGPENNRLSLVEWGDQGGRILLKHGKSQAQFNKCLHSMTPKGELHEAQGLQAAYKLPPLPGYEIQVLLITDGGLAINPKLVQLVEDAAYKGQYLNIAYMGPKEREKKLQSLSQLGKGHFYNLSRETDRERIRLMWEKGVF